MASSSLDLGNECYYRNTRLQPNHQYSRQPVSDYTNADTLSVDNNQDQKFNLVHHDEQRKIVILEETRDFKLMSRHYVIGSLALAENDRARFTTWWTCTSITDE